MYVRVYICMQVRVCACRMSVLICGLTSLCTVKINYVSCHGLHPACCVARRQPWLDKKHTVFGRVMKGMETCQEIGNTKTDKDEKPLEDVKIINVSVR